MVDLRGIDWEEVEASEIWRDAVLPLLENIQQDAEERMLSSKEPGEANYHLGILRAMKTIRETPGLVTQAKKLHQEQETENARETGRSRFAAARTRWLRRVRGLV